MKKLLIIITIIYSGFIVFGNNTHRPLLCETSIISRQQCIKIDKLTELDGLFQSHSKAIRFIFLSDRLSPVDVDNFVRNKKYQKNLLPANSPIWISKQDIAKSELFTILLSTKNGLNSSYVHQMYKTKDLSEKLPETLPYKSFIVYDKTEEIADTIFLSFLNSFWKQNLRPLNIVLVENVEKYRNLQSRLDRQFRVFGTFLYQNKLIGDVRINSSTISKSGYFSLPFDKYLRIFPKKPGYSFEPSCVACNFESQELERKVIAFPLKLDDKKIAEASAKNINQLQLYDVDIVTFKKNQSVFSFQKGTSQISLKNSGSNTDSKEFSISFWIYPTSKSQYQNIISQDTIFNIKLFKGNYCFTRVGISDNQLKKTPMILNEWSFMSFVVEQNTLTAYCNGIKTEKINIPSISLSNRDFQIGNNIWDEHFRGYLGSVCVWERALSDDEILLLYNSPMTNTNKLLVIVLLGILLLLGYAVFALKRNRRKETNIAQSQSQSKNTHQILPKETTQRRIQLIGNLHLWNGNKEDISLLMSDKQKHLFCLLVLKTIENGTGISSTEINNLLWPAMNTKSANNNRNVYIMRLKELFIRFPEIQVVFEKKHWKVAMTENVSCDYIEILNLEKELKEQKTDNLSQYLRLLNNGLLIDIEDTWIDRFKSNFEEERLNVLEKLLNENYEIRNYQHCLQIANTILALDEFNEHASDYKIKVLTNMGKRSQADKYKQNYALRYNEVYGKEED